MCSMFPLINYILQSVDQFVHFKNIVVYNESKIELWVMERISNFKKITKITLFCVLVQTKNPWDV